MISNCCVTASASEHNIYWSDGESGRLNGLIFRLANIEAPETGRLKQRRGFNGAYNIASRA